MKSKTILLLIAGLSLSVISSPVGAVSECGPEGGVAMVIMLNRQRGTMTLIELMDGLGKTPEFRPVILDAFDQPRMATPDMQDYMVKEFTNNWVLRCFNGEFHVPRLSD